MKQIRKRMLYFTGIIFAGLLLLGTGIAKGSGSTLSSIGGTMALLGGVRLIQFYKLSKDEEKRKKYEIAQNEERLIFIAHKSGYAVFLLTVFAQYLALIGLLLAGMEPFATYLGYMVGAQTLCYVALYAWYHRKY